MPPSSTPPRVLDQARLRALYDVEVLQSSAGEAFDRLSRLAARLVGAPIALVSFVDRDRQVIAGRTGFPEIFASVREIPLTHSFCQHVVGTDAPVRVDDARLDPALRDTPAVTRLGVAAYLGVPVRTADGHPLGALCAVDRAPRAWTGEEVALLEELAATATREVELHAELARRRREEGEGRVFRKIVDTMQLGVTVTGLDGRIVYTNAAEAAMHGYAPEELVGQPARILAPSDLWMDEAPARNARWSRDSVNVRADGTRFPVALWTDAVPGDDGAPAAWVTCSEDRGEHEAAARALRESRERLEGIIGSAMDAIVAVDEAQRILVFNAAAERMFGCPAHAAVGTPLGRFFPRAGELFAAERLTSRGMREAGQLTAVRTTGEEFPVEATFARAEADGQWLYTAIVRDVTERVQAEGEVALLVQRELASRARVNRILESITDAFFALDREWRFTYVNRAARDGEARREEVFYAPMGRWLQVHAYPGPEGVSLYLQDVTERRRAVEALRLSEERFRTAIDGGQVIVFSQDRDLRLTWMHGSPTLTMSDVAGKTDADWADYPEDAAEAVAIKRRVLERGVGERGEIRLRRGGSDRYYQLVVHPLRGAAGEVEGVTCAALDVTERKLQAEELRRGEALLRSVLEGIQDGIHLKDADGRYVLVNAAGARLVGRDPGELAGRRAADVFAPPAAAEIERTDRALLAGDKEAGVLEEVYQLGGRRVVVLTHKVVYRDPDGRPAGILGISRDVTEQRSLEAQALQAQRMEAVGRLAGGIAHDFNNLLMVIGGYARLLLGRTGPAEPGARELAEIRDAADRAAALTQQLLAFSSRQVMRARRMDLGALVREVEPMLCRLLGDAVAVEVRAVPGRHHVRADPAQVEQILVNLAVNSRDAMPHGGRMRIEVGAFVPAPGELEDHSELKPGCHVRLTVEDDGHGMDAATLAKAFEPFFTTREMGHGTGLGLSTVYGIVKQSGGHVWAESAAGAGTRVHVCFPQSPDYDPPATPGAATA